MLKYIIIFLVTILIIVATLFTEQYFLCIGGYIALVLLFIYLFSDNAIVFYLCIVFGATSAYYYLFGSYRLTKFNIFGEECVLTSAYYPYGYIEGHFESVDTVNINTHYFSLDYDTDVINTDVYIFKKDSTTYIYSRHKLILQGTQVEINEKDYGHGPISFFSFTDINNNRQHRDFFGKDISDKNYNPLNIYYTTVFTN